MPCIALPIPPRVAPLPVCDELRQVNVAIALVASGRVRRVAHPGRWVVWLVEGQQKPRMRVF